MLVCVCATCVCVHVTRVRVINQCTRVYVTRVCMGPVCDRDQCVFVCTQPVFVCKRASVRVSVCDYVTRAVCAMLL